MNISKEDFLAMLEKTVKDYYLIKEYKDNGLLINHNGWYEAKSKEAADPLSSFLVSARTGNYKGNFKIKLPSLKEIEKHEKIIREKKRSLKPDLPIGSFFISVAPQHAVHTPHSCVLHSIPSRP